MKLRPKIKIVLLALFVTSLILGLFGYSIKKAHQKGYKQALADTKPIVEQLIQSEKKKALMIQGRQIGNWLTKSCLTQNKFYIPTVTEKGLVQKGFSCHEIREI